MTTSRCPCGRTWTGTASAHCSVCHERFSTTGNFDLHKPKRRKANGEPGCGKPATMTRQRQDGSVVPVFKTTEGVYGVTWVGWSEETPYKKDQPTQASACADCLGMAGPECGCAAYADRLAAMSPEERRTDVDAVARHCAEAER